MYLLTGTNTIYNIHTWNFRYLHYLKSFWNVNILSCVLLVFQKKKYADKMQQHGLVTPRKKSL